MTLDNIWSIQRTPKKTDRALWKLNRRQSFTLWISSLKEKKRLSELGLEGHHKPIPNGLLKISIRICSRRLKVWETDLFKKSFGILEWELLNLLIREWKILTSRRVRALSEKERVESQDHSLWIFNWWRNLNTGLHLSDD